MTAGRNAFPTSHDWCTPPKYVTPIRDFFGGVIDLDPCSNVHSIVAASTEYRLPNQDGLCLSWNYPKIYVNPPYGADRERGTTIKHWLQRCAEANKLYDSEVLALIPVATNTSHWKLYVWGVASAVVFLYDTRLKFLVSGQGGDKGAPMSCAIVYWGKRTEDFKVCFSQFGAVVGLQSAISNTAPEPIKKAMQPSLFLDHQNINISPHTP
jgi:hypothetical protein